MGAFSGFSDGHYLLVVNICKLSTNNTSPQFHVVFVDIFHTLSSSLNNDMVVDSICDQLSDNKHDCCTKEEYKDGELVYTPPPLNKV